MMLGPGLPVVVALLDFKLAAESEPAVFGRLREEEDFARLRDGVGGSGSAGGITRRLPFGDNDKGPPDVVL